LIQEAQTIMRMLKTTEAGQLQLIQKVNFNALPIEKIERIAQRVQGLARAALVERL
jgi:hypothetical protein